MLRDVDNKILRSAYWGIGAIPPALGWASVLALLATGVTALTLLRSLPEMGAALGAFGIAGVSYLVGAVLDRCPAGSFQETRRRRTPMMSSLPARSRRTAKFTRTGRNGEVSILRPMRRNARIGNAAAALAAAFAPDFLRG